MGITPQNRISTKHQKCRGRTPRGCITIINKREGGNLYQKTCDAQLLITRPLRTFVKQPVQMGVTLTIILWLLSAQDSTHDIINSKQMANKTNPDWKTDLYETYR